MKAKDIGFIGGGRVTTILLEAMARQGMTLDGLCISDPSQTVREGLAERFPSIIICDDNQKPASREIVFVALHPPLFKEVLPGLIPVLREQSALVSLAPVLGFAKLSELAGGHQRIVRMIPNAPSLMNLGYNPVAFAPEVPRDQREALMGLFDVFGQHPEVDEAKLEAYAILTAMGPTYFWFQWQKLRELGQSFGLSPLEVDTGLEAMIAGSAKLLFQSGMSFEDVEDTVPVKPLAEFSGQIEEMYSAKLTALFGKLKGR
ncbi:MAG: NAD(P)-binding domain-containing protein [Desulfovibrio sp.]|nr:NAD(P)-binding domain-containing protein [Desulfovibrio sp.]MBI4958820.1 NAD(P)-binding domain-containing protein [Desulfovibrio sp.]